MDIANQLANLGRAPVLATRGNPDCSADQMPQLEDKPIGGSGVDRAKMQDAGLINNNRNALAELLAGMVMPGAMLKGGVKANQAMDAAIANAQRPNTLNTRDTKGQRGRLFWHGHPQNRASVRSQSLICPRSEPGKVRRLTGMGCIAQGSGRELAKADNIRRSIGLIGCQQVDCLVKRQHRKSFQGIGNEKA